MSLIDNLKEKINSNTLFKSDLDYYISSFTKAKYYELDIFRESLEWLRTYSFLLYLFEKNDYYVSSDDWKVQEVDFPVLFRTLNDMEDSGLFDYKTWSIGGNCTIKVKDSDNYRTYLYTRIFSRLDRIQLDISKEDERTDAGIKRIDKEITFYMRGKVPPSPKFPYVTLRKDSWDDYGHKTSYDLTYHIDHNQSIDLGRLRILHRSSDTTVTPNSFMKLTENYCSFASNLRYYNRLFDLGKTHYTKILTSLRDVAYDHDIYEEFKEVNGFKTSLFRGSESEKTLAEARNYFNETPNIKTESFTFTFSTKLDEAASPHNITFDFSVHDYKPFRLMALIGENGTGKTKYLSRLAQSLSGLNPRGSFDPERPLFSKIILISFSPFDSFIPSDNLRVSYSYFGLLNEKNEIDFEKAINTFNQSLNRIIEDDRLETWKDTLSIIIKEENLLKLLPAIKNVNNININDFGFSSGQKLLIVILTNIIATISRDSLILFDEPETFLHPSLVSKLMSALYTLTDRFSSFSIISTHSPIVLQEIPSSSVRILERQGDIPSTRMLEIECFGENLSAITNEVFRIDSTNVNYQKHLDKMMKTLNYRQIMREFDNNLSFNARMYIKSKKDISDN